MWRDIFGIPIFTRFSVRGFAFVCSIAVLSGGVRGDAFSRYYKIGSFSLPTGAVMFDSLPDGRMITLSGATVYLETAPASCVFASAGDLPDANISPSGPAFLRVSPDGTRIAVGNNGGANFATFRVGVFDLDTLDGQWFHAEHFEAAWVDDSRLALTAGGPVSRVTILNTNSDPLNPDNRTVISGMGGYSGGVGIDSLGNLYAGNGFKDEGPSDTGTIKAFTPALWEAAYQGSPSLQFESQGTLITDLLSATPLIFDHEGNLLVGGSDPFEAGESGHIAVIRAAVLLAALGGGGPINENDPTKVRRLDPEPQIEFEFYNVVVNRPLGRAYARDFPPTSPVQVFLDTSTVPAASTWGIIYLALLVSIAGSLVLRRQIETVP